MKPAAAQLRQTAFAVAYRMLGNSQDAEDLAQECVLKYLQLDSSSIEDHHAYIAKISARASLNFLRARQTRQIRADHISLPLPYFVSDEFAADARLDLSYGIVVLTQTMTPLSRAVFILRSAFELSFSEIGEAFERTPGACRQAFDRGKRKIRSHNAEVPRKQVSSIIIGELAKHILAGDIPEITKLLAEDIIFYSDGGGVGPDIGKPISGVQRIARFLAVSPNLLHPDTQFRVVNSPYGPLLVSETAGRLSLLLIAELSASGLIALYAISDPVKLARMEKYLRS